MPRLPRASEAVHRAETSCRLAGCRVVVGEGESRVAVATRIFDSQERVERRGNEIETELEEKRHVGEEGRVAETAVPRACLREGRKSVMGRGKFKFFLQVWGILGTLKGRDIPLRALYVVVTFSSARRAQRRRGDREWERCGQS